jgi:CBS domain-containing protein
MKEHNQAAVLICHEDESLVGIFTERDALRLMADGHEFETRLDQVMTRNPGTVSARETVGRAIAYMSRQGYRRLPIVDDHRRPVGMIKVENILRYLVEHFPEVIYNLPPEPHQVTQEREGA